MLMMVKNWAEMTGGQEARCRGNVQPEAKIGQRFELVIATLGPAYLFPPISLGGASPG
jgi:hypothetical protein